MRKTTLASPRTQDRLDWRRDRLGGIAQPHNRSARSHSQASSTRISLINKKKKKKKKKFDGKAKSTKPRSLSVPTASASPSFSTSRPPAWAIVSRPPPPPPTTAAAALTISPARTPRSTSAGATLDDQRHTPVDRAAKHDDAIAGQLALDAVDKLGKRLWI